MLKRKPFDLNAYSERVKSGQCFICDMLEGNNPHHIIFQNEFSVAFLNKYPVLYGYVLVAPKKHREHVTSDFTREEYLTLQEFVFNVSEAVKKAVPTERIYLLSLGSEQGNSHVHWHIAPLPPGVPYDEQQFEALAMRRGILEISEEEMAQLAQRIRIAMEVKIIDLGKSSESMT